MRPIRLSALLLSMLMLLSACGTAAPTEDGSIAIKLHDETITVDGRAISGDSTAAVYAANDIVYYEDGHDFTYGEGSETDAHSAEEAAAHTVVHITKPGTYRLSGTLSRGQIAVDLGEDAEEDPAAVVTLILDGADITCKVAPGILFYRVYECGDTEQARADVDTSAAGANIVIADGSTNTVNGSYVARIYKEGTVELNEDGTEVADAKKLHKYDGAVYSKMSMNVSGGTVGDGLLTINAENEGLDSELHLTLNGGSINIFSGNDGINTNEDGLSVTTVNGGTLDICVTGETGEGDGIDSNGYLVINGGTVTTCACADSADAGIDADLGIYIRGGTVVASGHMLSGIEAGGQPCAVFSFPQRQQGGTEVLVKDSAGQTVLSAAPENDFTSLVVSAPPLTEGIYTLWCDGVQLSVMSGGMGGGMMRPEGEMMEIPEGMTPPEGMEMPEGTTPPERMEMPEGMTPPEGMEMPEGMTPPEGMERPEGMARPEGGHGGMGAAVIGEAMTEFTITSGGNMFTVVQ